MRRNAKEEVFFVFAALCLGLAITFLAAYIVSAYSNKIQGGIAGEIIRFHILANSDSQADQKLKLELRDAIFDKYGGQLSLIDNAEAAKAYLEPRLSEIESFSRDFMRSSGVDCAVSARLEKADFPTRDYGGLSFPAGRYTALNITIGQGEGHNFWCVMFPPLCFVDAAKGEVTGESKDAVRETLNAEEYAITAQEEPEYVIKFKVVELWQKIETWFK